MRRKVRTSITLVLSLFLVSPLFLNATYPNQNLLYSGFISPERTLEWNVSLLEWFGNESKYLYPAYIGNTNVSQGDLIQIKIKQDPNNLQINLRAEGNWYDLKLNDQNQIYNSEDIHLGNHQWIYGDFFISPVKYLTNNTVYQLFEVYYDYLNITHDYYYNNEYYIDAGEGYSIIVNNTDSLQYDLSNKLFKATIYYCEYICGEDNRYEGEEESILEIFKVVLESTIDIERGTLYYYKFNVDYYYNYTSVIEADEFEQGYYHLLVENTDKTIGYIEETMESEDNQFNTIFGINVNYIVIGMGVFTGVFVFTGVILKRARNKVKNTNSVFLNGNGDYEFSTDVIETNPTREENLVSDVRVQQ